MLDKVKYYIEKLQLQPHPEGGYYKEIYRSAEYYTAEHLPGRYKGNRSFSTSIYFLLEGKQVSLFHRLKSDEVWHYYDGSPVKIYVLDEYGELSEIVLGKNLESGETLQTVLKKNCWFGAEIIDKSSFCLFGCTVAPGFDFDDFELGTRINLISLYPHHKKIIEKFTK